MKPLSATLALPRKPAARSEREELLDFFLGKLNAGRKGTKYKPVTVLQLASLLKGKSTSDLYQLKAICSDTERQYEATRYMEDKRGAPFSAAFFTRLKKKI